MGATMSSNSFLDTNARLNVISIGMSVSLAEDDSSASLGHTATAASELYYDISHQKFDGHVSIRFL